MTKMLLPTFSVAALVLVGCAPAPLYLPDSARGAVTTGEVPRDARGEPVWEAIPPVPDSGAEPDAR